MVEPQALRTCLSCGTALSIEHKSEGLCPACLLELALDTPEPSVGAGPSQEAPTLDFSEAGVAEGKIHGERYRIRSLLGRGGMGEVWRAYDLKLHLDVALKSLRRELIEDPQALETLRQEVRTAREVISPNVCRVFDLHEVDGQEWISMEYVDGESLLEILRERGPLELDEAREIASQFLAGLEAIHDAGLIHRDIKPENIMITRTGRVVVMDFGIAKSLEEGNGGLIAGTPAYMAPEQMGDDDLDSRSDVFAAGVVLAEMVAPDGIGSLKERKLIWKGIHAAEPRIAETPWAAVIGKAVVADRDSRFGSAHVLARALEEVTLRAAGDEDARPYPGLSSFTEEDAPYFFGRELEVEGLWKKLRRPQLLALIAPSGAGKSSFLRAGLMPTLPDGWRAIVATPGQRPFSNLAQSLLPELAEDDEAAGELLRFEDPEIATSLVSRWRRRHEHVLIVIDQFEELFTQTPEALQPSFVELISRLPLAADAHVLLVMREDFLFHCQPFEGLAPIFSRLTPLGALGGSSLRRAVVQPALKCGYRFEDDALVDEMVAEVSHERGALPLLAFAAAQLWSKRDRETGLIIRRAYEEIGGVGGALAQHAEATLQTIGEELVPTVRELFRNLVTAQGTRAARTREELLSVFRDTTRGGDRETAAQILDALVDARLLTSYDAVEPADEKASQQRVEIIHESLLFNWPRLVRWRTQDAEGAQLRDDLRQAAQRWHEKGRPDHLLWTGTSFKEFELWRERYPGGLTVAEEEFTEAAVELAGRTRQRRRFAVAAVFALLVGGLITVGGFWKQSETARREAIEETRRAEASKLVALGQNTLEGDPTEALAHALASLELSDNEPARLLALEALWRSPTALQVPNEQGSSAAISPDGKWMALGNQLGVVKILPRDGGAGTSVKGHEGEVFSVEFVTIDILASHAPDGKVNLWQIPGLELIRSLPVDDALDFKAMPGGDGRPGVVTWEESGRVKWWPVAGGEPIIHGSVAHQKGRFFADFYWDIDPVGRSFVYGRGDRIFKEPLGELGVGEPELIGVAPLDVRNLAVSPDGRMVATGFQEPPGVRLWALEPPYGEITLPELPMGTQSVDSIAFSADSARLAAAGISTNFYLWDLEGPPEAEPLVLHRRGAFPRAVAFSPDASWLVTVESSATNLWPIGRKYASVLRKAGGIWGIGVAPDGSWVAASGPEEAKIWPSRRVAFQESRYLIGPQVSSLRMAVSPDGSTIAVGSEDGQLRALAPDGNSTRTVKPYSSAAIAVAFGPRGRLLASGGGFADAEDAFIRVRDLETDETRDLDPGHGAFITRLAFTPDGRLIESSLHSLAIWDLSTGARRMLHSGPVWDGQPGSEGDSVVFLEGTGHFQGIPRHIDVDSGELLPIADWDVVCGLTVTRDGELVAADLGGTLQVGSLASGSPHLLFGHEGWVMSVTESTEWLVSGGVDDGTVRIWPKPDVDKTPFHLLPYEDLLAGIRTLTNVRVVRDEQSETGYRTEIVEFPGWAEFLEW